MFRISVCVCTFLLLVGCVLPLVGQQAQPQTVTYYACINNSTGAIRIVSKNTVCKSTEHKINWNQAGPQGPKGPAGPQGPPGVSVGNSAILPASSNIPLFGSTVILQTNPIRTSGLYYITASALVGVDLNDGAAFCFDQLTSTQQYSQWGGGSFVGGYQQASVTDALNISAGDSVQLVCVLDSYSGNSFVFDAGMTATLIDSGSDAPRVNPHAHRRPNQIKKTN